MNVYLTDILYHVSYVGQLLLKNFFHDDDDQQKETRTQCGDLLKRKICKRSGKKLARVLTERIEKCNTANFIRINIIIIITVNLLLIDRAI